MKHFLLPVMFIVVFTSCRKDTGLEAPACIGDSITSFKPSTCENASVKEYTFQGKEVYLFDPGACCCDLTSSVLDGQCTTLGYLGGIGGLTQINGEDFSNAVYVRTVWEK